MDIELKKVRESIPVTKHKIYLDNAGSGPPPLQVLNSMKRYLEGWAIRGEMWDEVLMDIIESRKLFAKLIGATINEIAAIPNVTTGIVAVASSINYKDSCNIVVSSHNFPTNVYLWHLQQNYGNVKEVRMLRQVNGVVPIESYERAVDDKTSVVAVDHVAWLNGYRENIREVSKIAHEHGAMTIVDAFHSVGVIPVDVKKEGIDVLVCGTYKWLMGPHGAAFLYVNRDVMEDLNPKYIGWHGVKDSVINRVMQNKEVFGEPFDLTATIPSESATRFEWGTWSAISMVGARAALDFIIGLSVPEKFESLLNLVDRLVMGLIEKDKRIISPLERDRRSAILSFEEANPKNLVDRLMVNNIIVSARPSLVRISPHFYNTKEEIDKLIDCLDG